MIIGLDVSTSVTGLCVLDDSGNIVELTAAELTKYKTMWDKADEVSRRLVTILTNHGPSITRPDVKFRIAVEEPLMGFQKGMSSAATITTLMKFNGIVSYIARNTFDSDPEYISAAHARKLCGIKMQRVSIAGISGKEQVFSHMAKNDLKDFSWPKKKSGKIVDWSRDATDAYVIAKAASLQTRS
jgi:Holliday junction resolvasome RuvABC endonuclease subunit